MLETYSQEFLNNYISKYSSTFLSALRRFLNRKENIHKTCKKVYFNKICKKCNVSFSSTSLKTEYCCEYCKKKQPDEKYIGKCEICGKDVFKWQKKKKFICVCSYKCYQKLYRKRKYQISQNNE